ncbi:MAG: hypothetical protein WC483_03385 [Candidatus Paceibacterota bacterium]
MKDGLVTPINYLFRLSGREVESSAVVIVDSRSSFKATESDPALGPQGPGMRCATCTLDAFHCPGHIGAMRIYPLPVTLAEKNLALWLACICHRCGRIGLSIEERSIIRQRKGGIDFKDIQASLQAKGHDYLCPFCSAPFQVFRPVGFFTSFKYDYTKPALFYVDFPGRKSETMEGRSGYHDLPIADNYYVWSVLQKAAKEDCLLFGWDSDLYHPQCFMSDYIPIAPPQASPQTGSSSRYMAGKPHKLMNIISEYQVRISTTIGNGFLPQIQKEMTGDPSAFHRLILDIHFLYYAITMLQSHLPDGIQTIVSKELKISTQKGGGSFIDMLRQKQGILRKLMAGARHNVNIRTPLTAFTFGAIGTTTCPLDFAMKICVERTVTPENIELMRALVRNGPDCYPGANAYKKGGKAKIAITKKDSEAIASSLVPGDVILRHILTGDVALHQRYPSIREESIHAVMMHVDPGKLVRAPIATCAMMMADFDGDDTELFIVSSYGVAIEALYLSSVLQKVIAPFDGRPIIGMGGDAGGDPVFGITLLRKRREFTQREVNALFAVTFTDVEPPKGKEVYTYGDLVSALLPRDYYYDAKANGDSPGGDLLIEGGVVTRGDLSSKGFEILGDNNAHVTKSVATSIDPYTAIKILEDITRIAYRANTMYGWSISDEMRLVEPFRTDIRALVEDRVRDINSVCTRFHLGELAIPVGQDPIDFFERMVGNAASKNAVKALSLIQDMMKGSLFDYYGYTQAFKSRLPAALISRGQVMPEGHRLRPRLSHSTRHTAWFPKCYDGADAGGYIQRSHCEKFDPPSHFAEGIQARKEVFSKGVSIQEQGYYNRKVSTSLGPVHVGYLGEVRGHGDAILDFTYGHTGASSRCSIGVIVDAHLVSDAEFKTRYGLVKDEYDTLLVIRNEWRAAIADYAVITSNTQFSPTANRFDGPFDMNAIIMAYTPGKGEVWKAVFGEKAASAASKGGEEEGEGEGKEEGKKTTAKEVTKTTTPAVPLTQEQVWAILKTMRSVFARAHVGRKAGAFLNEIVGYRVDAFMRLFRFVCHSGRFATGWTEKELREMLKAMLLKYALSLAPAGDMVGLKASLNIVAPQSQAQLHSIRGGKEIKGTSSSLLRSHGTTLFREVTEGLNPKHPISSFALAGEAKYDLQECLDYVKRLSSVRLNDVLYEAWMVSVAPDELDKTTECGFNKLRDYVKSLPPTLKQAFDRSKGSWFYMVLHIDVYRLLTNHVEIATIGKRLQNQFPDIIESAISVYENMEGLFVFLSFKAESIRMMRSYFDAIIEKGVVHGNPAFSNGTIIKYKGIPMISSDGSLVEKESYRVALNGCDLPFLFAQREIDKRTIFTSNVIDSAEYFGIEEARFRAFEEMAAETYEMEELRSLLRQHMKVFVDYLAYRGTLTFVPRFALGSNPDVSDLDKMTFETADALLIDALENTKWRPIRSIMPCNLFGIPLPFGSSMTTIQIRTEALQQKAGDDVMEELKSKRVKKGKESLVVGGSAICDSLRYARVESMPLDEDDDGGSSSLAADC